MKLNLLLISLLVVLAGLAISNSAPGTETVDAAESSTLDQIEVDIEADSETDIEGAQPVLETPAEIDLLELLQTPVASGESGREYDDRERQRFS